MLDFKDPRDRAVYRHLAKEGLTDAQIQEISGGLAPSAVLETGKFCLHCKKLGNCKFSFAMVARGETFSDEHPEDEFNPFKGFAISEFDPGFESLLAKNLMGMFLTIADYNLSHPNDTLPFFGPRRSDDLSDDASDAGQDDGSSTDIASDSSDLGFTE
jgi:hypothetical protein